MTVIHDDANRLFCALKVGTELQGAAAMDGTLSGFELERDGSAGLNPGEHSLKLGTPGLKYGRPLAFKTN